MDPSLKCDCMAIEFDEGPDSPSIGHFDLIEENRNAAKELIKLHGSLELRKISIWDSSGVSRRRVGSRNAARIFSNIRDVAPYSDIVVDISALPRSLYFPLIGRLLGLLDQLSARFPAPNLLVVACENQLLDSSISDVGVDDDASYMPGFAAELEAESYREVPTVWFPVLGESQGIQLQRLYELIDPDEVVLVLPWPSMNPRRADALIGEYHDLLFDQWRIEPGNVLYAPERNPFEAYKQIRQSALRYNEALGPLGGCKTAISAISSKLLSLGALLTAYELRKLALPVGLAHVEAKGHLIREGLRPREFEDHDELVCLWLFGECYDT